MKSRIEITLIVCLSLLFVTGCQSKCCDKHIDDQEVSEESTDQQASRSNESDLSKLIGNWESERLEIDHDLRIWPKTKAIRLTIREVSHDEVISKPYPYEKSSYAVAMYEKIEGREEWLPVPDTEDGWIDRSDPKQPLVFRLGPVGSHIALEASLEGELMVIQGAGLNANLRMTSD